MKFTADWFSHNVKGISSCLSRLQNRDKFLEIGCYEGLSTTWFIKNFLNENGSITVIDTFEGGEEHKSYVSDSLYETCKQNIDEVIGEDQKYHIIKDTSYNGLAKLILNNEKFDFIYIDGSHTAADVLTDAVMAFPLLNSGGMMIFDDYTWGFNLGDKPYIKTEPLKCPKYGIDAFGYVFNNLFKEILCTNQIGIMKL
jgi:predicted O-methyltransferase YrrM